MTVIVAGPLSGIGVSCGSAGANYNTIAGIAASRLSLRAWAGRCPGGGKGVAPEPEVSRRRSCCEPPRYHKSKLSQAMSKCRKPKTASARNSGARCQDWYKDAVIYQLHVRAFYDSNVDGIGDFCGLALKLGYIKDLVDNAYLMFQFL